MLRGVERPHRIETSPWTMAERVDAICQPLPEVMRYAEGWARHYKVRDRTFCFFSGYRHEDGQTSPYIVLRAEPDEQRALLELGHPFLPNRGGFDRVEVRLDDDTDWVQLGELLIESYRKMAPKKLSRALG
jgi:hypothetical protein